MTVFWLRENEGRRSAPGPVAAIVALDAVNGSKWAGSRLAACRLSTPELDIRAM
jgi:hypothetical protein